MKRLTLALLLAACAPPPQTPAPPPTPTQTPAPTPTPTPTQTPAPTPTATTAPPRTGVYETGFASWYGKALAGHKTASGERFDPSKLTAAHRTLRLGTVVDVRRTDNGRVVRVRINDRGPVSHRFVIDLSSEAARRLGMLRMGVAPVELRIVSR